MSGPESSPLLISPLIEYLWRVARLPREGICHLFKSHSPDELLKRVSRDPKRLLRTLPPAYLRDSPAFISSFNGKVSQESYLTPADSLYPLGLPALSDPPWVLYYRGDSELWNFPGPRIGVVGTRRATPYALEVTAELVEAMGPFSPLIISGLALGVDGVAHRTALKEGMKTVGVLGTPLDRPYPMAHHKLHQEIGKQGLLLTEVYPGAMMGPWRFPERNRILAALSDAVLVVEAPIRSGALVTAQHALEIGKEVFVVPGSLLCHQNAGGHRLIQEGAHLLTHPREIFSVLGYSLKKKKGKVFNKESAEKKEQAHPSLGQKESEILRILSSRPLHIDKIVGISQRPAPAVTTLLMGLCLKGWVQELPGGIFKIIK